VATVCSSTLGAGSTPAPSSAPTAACALGTLLAEEHLSDLAERYQAYGLGGPSPYTYDVSEDGRESLRERHFAQYPRNPFVHLRHWK